MSTIVACECKTRRCGDSCPCSVAANFCVAECSCGGACNNARPGFKFCFQPSHHFRGAVCACRTGCRTSSCPCMKASIRCGPCCHDVCHNHESNVQIDPAVLDVQRSTISPNAGDGVFALENIPAGTRICGELLYT